MCIGLVDVVRSSFVACGVVEVGAEEIGMKVCLQ